MTNESPLKRLKSKNAIERLFREGGVVQTKNLLFRYVKQEKGNGFYIGVSVAKRNVKRAVDRNRIKRQLRVVVKKNVALLPALGMGMLIYKGRRLQTTQSIIEETRSLFSKIKTQ